MRKPLELPDGIKLYAKSMGKLFRVYAICETADEANTYCERHPDAAVIAEHDGRIFIACQYAAVARSEAIAD